MFCFTSSIFKLLLFYRFSLDLTNLLTNDIRTEICNEEGGKFSAKNFFLCYNSEKFEKLKYSFTKIDNVYLIIISMIL